MAKIEVARRAAAGAGIDLFINARTDVYLRGLVAPEERLRETLERARRYREAGCDGLFVPGLVNPEELSTLVKTAGVPLNVMALPGLAPAARLEALGVRRLSLGMALAQAALGTVRRHCSALLERGEYGGLFDEQVAYAEMNAVQGPCNCLGVHACPGRPPRRGAAGGLGPLGCSGFGLNTMRPGLALAPGPPLPETLPCADFRDARAAL